MSIEYEWRVRMKYYKWKRERIWRGVMHIGIKLKTVIGHGIINMTVLETISWFRVETKTQSDNKRISLTSASVGICTEHCTKHWTEKIGDLEKGSINMNRK